MLCRLCCGVSFPFPSRCRVLVKGVDRTVYRRKFRERLGELTPRNLDHPVPVGLVDIGGRRALIYGNPWRGLSSHPVPVLHPTDCKGNNQHCSQAYRASGWSCTDFLQFLHRYIKLSCNIKAILLFL